MVCSAPGQSVFENLLLGGRIAVLLCWGLSDVMVRQALAFWSVAGANGSACPVWVMMVSSMDTSDGLLLQPGSHVAHAPGRDLWADLAGCWERALFDPAP